MLCATWGDGQGVREYNFRQLVISLILESDFPGDRFKKFFKLTWLSLVSFLYNTGDSIFIIHYYYFKTVDLNVPKNGRMKMGMLLPAEMYLPSKKLFDALRQ